MFPAIINALSVSQLAPQLGKICPTGGQAERLIGHVLLPETLSGRIFLVSNVMLQYRMYIKTKLKSFL